MAWSSVVTLVRHGPTSRKPTPDTYAGSQNNPGHSLKPRFHDSHIMRSGEAVHVAAAPPRGRGHPMDNFSVDAARCGS